MGSVGTAIISYKLITIWRRQDGFILEEYGKPQQIKYLFRQLLEIPSIINPRFYSDNYIEMPILGFYYCFLSSQRNYPDAEECADLRRGAL
jgi:hypothetical protein